jgi:cytochrome oxidase Cu insertion factor (SCO1/SenC/PrrC family)
MVSPKGGRLKGIVKRFQRFYKGAVHVLTGARGPSMKKRFIVLGFVFLIVGFGVGLAIKSRMQSDTMEQDIEGEQEIASLTAASGDEEADAATIIKPPTSEADPSMPGVSIGGPFTLVNQDGKTVTEKDFAGNYLLVFFGFTYCPEVCPTELQKISRVMELVGPDKAAKIQPVFISVDPERDDVQTVKEYIGQFHEKLVGLTGTPEQVEAVKKAYKVFASKIQMEGMDGYMMDHSAFTYLMGPDGANIALYPAKDTAEQIAEDLKGKI